MKPTPLSTLASHRTAVRCAAVACAACRIPLDQFAALRQKPLALPHETLPPALLKHADEQTVAALIALGEAMKTRVGKGEDYSGWGVLAAPRFFGRAALAMALHRFAAEGAWGISPHLIPHRSLHAVSGTISQALKMHGPNYGVGGGADSAAEALLAAAALVSGGQLPGLWLVLTGFDPEMVPADPADASATPPRTECLAVALALAAARDEELRYFLTVGPRTVGDEVDDWPMFSLEDLVATLGRQHTEACWQLRCGGWAVWQSVAATVESCA